MWRTYTNNTDTIKSFIDVDGEPVTAGLGETIRYEVSRIIPDNLGNHDDVALSNLAAGAVLYRNASGKWTNLPKGAEGRVLTLGANIPDWEGIKKLGAGNNFTKIAADGVVTFEGNARIKRHVIVVAPSWTKGASAPEEKFIGIVPVLGFDKALDDEAYYALLVPWRIEAGTIVQALVDWCYEGAQDNGTVCWNLDYIDLAEGDLVGGSAVTVSKTSPGSHVTGTMVRTSLAPNVLGLVAHNALGLRLWRDESEDTLDTDACLIEVHFEFIEDKLGEPI